MFHHAYYTFLIQLKYQLMHLIVLKYYKPHLTASVV